MTEILSSDPHPAWKVLVLVYDATDFTYTDGAGSRHVVGQIGQARSPPRQAAATRFVLTDIPLLSSGNMVPSVTVRFPGTLTRLSPNASDGGLLRRIRQRSGSGVRQRHRDLAADVTDQSTGESLWIGSAAVSLQRWAWVRCTPR